MACSGFHFFNKTQSHQLQGNTNQISMSGSCFPDSNSHESVPLSLCYQRFQDTLMCCREIAEESTVLHLRHQANAFIQGDLQQAFVRNLTAIHHNYVPSLSAPSRSTFLRHWVAHHTCLWLTGRIHSPNQSGKRCPDWSEMNKELSKIQIVSHRGRRSQLETAISTSPLTNSWWMAMPFLTNYTRIIALNL